MDPFEQLGTPSHDLLADARRLVAIVECPIPDAATVAAIRWRMANRIAGAPGPIADAFAAYLNGWPVARIVREWAEFRTETHRLLGAPDAETMPVADRHELLRRLASTRRLH